VSTILVDLLAFATPVGAVKIARDTHWEQGKTRRLQVCHEGVNCL
jgi:hypothetical protein